MSRPPQALTSLGVLLAGWIGARMAFSAFSVPASHIWPDRPWHEIVDSGAIPQAAAKEVTISLPPEEPARPQAAPARPPKAHLPNKAGGTLSVPLTGTAAKPAASIAPHSRPAPNMPGTPYPKAVRAEDGWSLSAWALYRRGNAPQGIAPNGQLGGSQTGLRLQRHLWRLSPRTRLSANMRLSSPLEGQGGQEAAFGMSLARAGRVPLELLVERRVGIGRNGRNAFAAIVVTGLNDAALPLSFRLNGYAQGGMVGVKSRDAFIDGALRVERAVAETGDAKIDIGIGIWGAAQPGVSRLDVGPSAGLRFRVGKASLRAGAEWRERVSGRARPGSGPAMTLGVDY